MSATTLIEPIMVLPTFLEDVWHIVIWPEVYFASLRTHPYWVEPLLISSLATIILAYCTHRYTLKCMGLPMRKQMLGSLPDSPARSMGASMFAIPIAIGLFHLFLKCGPGAIVLTLVADLIAGEGRLLPMLALTSTLSLISLLEPIHALFWLMHRGNKEILNSTSYEARLGLRYLAPGARPGLAILLGSMNIYQVLTLWFAVVGIGSLCECSRATSLVIVSVYWVMLTGFRMMSAEVFATANKVLAAANNGTWGEEKEAY